MAADLLERNVAVIAATGGPDAAQAAKDATSTIPIVFANGVDPVALGLVQSLARPGGNVTGFKIMNVELIPKRLQLLAELVPHAKPVALLVNPTNPNGEPTARDAQQAASALGMQLHILNATTANEIEAVFTALDERHVGAMLVGGDSFFSSRHAQITALAARSAVPAIYEFCEFAVTGGLISYAPNLAAIYRDVGTYVARFLKGEKPADLPVQQPTRFELVVNQKTAKTLGLEIPQSILARADEVIE